MPTVTNWGGNVAFGPLAVAGPEDETSRLALLDRPDARTIRARGRLHGFNEFVCTDDLLVDSPRSGRWSSTRRDRPSRPARRDGRRGRRFPRCTRPRPAGARQLHGPDAGHGAIATATHGAGEPSMSHFVVRLRVATYDPDTGSAVIITWQEGDPELPAARCAIGLLGIVLEVTLRVIPAHLVEETYAVTKDVTRLLEWNRRYPHQYFLWFPFAWYFGLLNRRILPAGWAPVTRSRSADRTFDLIQTRVVRGLAFVNRRTALPAAAVASRRTRTARSSCAWSTKCSLPQELPRRDPIHRTPATSSRSSTRRRRTRWLQRRGVRK